MESQVLCSGTVEEKDIFHEVLIKFGAYFSQSDVFDGNYKSTPR